MKIIDCNFDQIWAEHRASCVYWNFCTPSSFSSCFVPSFPAPKVRARLYIHRSFIWVFAAGSQQQRAESSAAIAMINWSNRERINHFHVCFNFSRKCIFLFDEWKTSLLRPLWKFLFLYAKRRFCLFFSLSASSFLHALEILISHTAESSIPHTIY